ncbi:MAG TPA: TolC family protein [Gemmataceae bacterium]|nr:TolC family protein [Gemmataceae bacterium]
MLQARNAGWCGRVTVLSASLGLWMASTLAGAAQDVSAQNRSGKQPASGEKSTGPVLTVPTPASPEAMPLPRTTISPANPPAAANRDAVGLPLAEISPPGQYPDVQVLPIDLPTALRLVNTSNPTIALAQERVREAQAALLAAQVLWLPNLQTGPAYLRHDGQIQNAAGLVFGTSKSNFFEGGGASAIFHTGDALFGPLIARRLAEAQVAAAQGVKHSIQLDVALAYLDLMQAYGALAINADTLGRAQFILDEATKADTQGLSRTKADVTRARAEVELRRQQHIDLENQAALASARLAQLLLLQPTVDLRPADPAVVPITLVPAETDIDTLVVTGLMNRPELAESRALVAASLARWRQARLGPLLPRVELDYSGGVFGGGVNDDVSKFSGRSDGLAQAVWEFRNLGLGNVAEARLRRSQYNQANYHGLEVQAQVAADVAIAVKLARNRQRTLASAQVAVEQALETWRRLKLAAFGILTRDNLVNTLEPVIAEQSLDVARTQYLTEVIEYNKAQFRLYEALGQPPIDALPQAVPVPTTVPVAPQPYTPTPMPVFKVPPPVKRKP